MSQVLFWCSGRPAAQSRPRVTRNGVYDTPPTKRWKAHVRTCGVDAANRVGGLPFHGPLRAQLQFYFPPPTSLRKADQAAMLGRWRVLKPDADNLAKAVLDALNGVVFVDDAQVVDLAVSKRYGMKAGVRVHVEEIL